MTFRKPLSFVALALAVLVVGTIAWRQSVYDRLPRYEGRTADEWVDEFAQRFLGVYVFEEVDAKEADLVFRSLGASAQRQLIKECVEYRPKTAFQNWLLSVGWRLPWQLRVGPFADRKAQRWSVCKQVLERIRPGWEVFEPVYREVQSRGDDEKLAATLESFQYLGNDCAQAIPILVDGLTNRVWKVVRSSMWALGSIGTNAAPALSRVLPGLLVQAEPEWELDFLGNLGPMATNALPVLERWLKQASSPIAKKNLAITILMIDPLQKEALQYLEMLISNPGAFDQAEVSSADFQGGFGLPHPPPSNATFARLLSQLLVSDFADRSDWLMALWQHDPGAARNFALANRFEGDAAFSSVMQMLEHDAYDPFALEFVKERFVRPFPPDTGLWLMVLWPCRSNSPEVMEVLKLSEAQGEVFEIPRQEIDLARRHIELNDRLWQLRNKPPADKVSAIGR